MTSVLDKVRRLAARRNRRARPRVPLLLALVALACGDDRAVDPPPPTPVASVAVGPERLTLAVGSSAALDAVALAADGAVLEGRPVTWSASPGAVATVSATGVVGAVAPGTATVTATVGGRVGTATIVVPAPGEEPGGNPPPVRPTLAAIAPTQMTDGHDAGFTLTVTGAGFAPDAIVVFGGVPLQTTWVGATTLRARVTPAEVANVGSFAVRVVNPPLPAELHSEPVTFTVVPRLPSTVRVASPTGSPWTWTGVRLPLAAQALDLAGRPLPNRVPSWTSDREDVATVLATGDVLGVSAGVASVTATVDGVASGRVPVRVHEAPAFGLVWSRGIGPARRLAIWFPTDGGAPYVVQTAITAYDPSPSPDGRHIAFTGVAASGEVDVYVLTRAGGAVRRLTTADGLDDMPAWSPDGSRIAFRSMRAGRSDVWVMDAGGTNARRLTDEAGGAATGGSGDPAWSPDGAQLAYAHGAGADRDIWIMRADGSGTRRLTRDAEDEREPTWSPDGATIAYRVGAGAGARIVARRIADGGDAAPVATIGAGATPAFAPEGGWLAFAAPTGLGHTLQVTAPGTLDGARTFLPATLDAGANVAWIRR